ncbi:hypothetical protein LEMLEM_LOCUS16972 [Lemmus lemmus]
MDHERRRGEQAWREVGWQKKCTVEGCKPRSKETNKGSALLCDPEIGISKGRADLPAIMLKENAPGDAWPTAITRSSQMDSDSLLSPSPMSLKVP